MKKLFTITILLLLAGYGMVEAQERVKMADTRVDNNRYYIKMAKEGKATLNPMVSVQPAQFTGSEIRALSSITEDSPDFPVTSENSTQSETSIFVDPNDNMIFLNSNNSTQNPVGSLYGANDLYTFDGGATMEGEVQGAGGSNSGDPVSLISNDGRWYVGYIRSSGQGVSWSDDQGATWSRTMVASGVDLLDKNHMWIDNSTASPYEGNLYNAWTDFGGAFNNNIGLSYSADRGETWSAAVNVSASVGAGSHDQGVNISTGPNGEVYAVWAIYDSWPIDENAIGMARSFDGGVTWESFRIISSIRGIRNSEVGKNMRVNAFPVITVDISGGADNGNLYVVWANIGVPGVNGGSSADIYMIRSTDQGDTWSEPIRVNQDPIEEANQQWFPWITCDPANGILSAVYYDDRNVGGGDAEVYCANSSDAGESWEDFKVSDVSFTPTPIPGLATGYMGDYLGINANNGWVYPVWADNRSGTVMSYVSPYQTNPLQRPNNLTADVEFETGNATLDWSFEGAPDFSHFNIYREGEFVTSTTETTYEEILPDYGIYTYQLTAAYDPEGESSPVGASVQWGDAHISVVPDEISASLLPDSSTTKYVTISNIGQLKLDYAITPFIQSSPAPSRAYCAASGGGDEYISRVVVGEIDNASGSDGYSDFTVLSTVMTVGNVYEMTVTNGTPSYPTDKCGIWIDWNQNEDFTDDEPIIVSGSPGVGPYTANITPPPGAFSGPTRMRTRIVYYGDPAPCDDSDYGEVEDYTINVISWLQTNPTIGEIEAGEDQEIEVALNAVGMELGTYYAELRIGSNDPDAPQVIVPVNLLVTELAVALMADPAELCIGGSTMISSEVVGATGEVSYAWTSDPAGFTSEEPNIEVQPDTTTTYMVSIDDGTLQTSNQLTIAVHPYPEVELGDNQEICVGDSAMFVAGDGADSYLWNTGETTPMIYAKTDGWYKVDVMNEFDCATVDSAYLTVLDIPAKASVGSGPVEVDLYEATTSTYTADEVTYSAEYVWEIMPEAAGTIMAVNMEGEVSWAEGYVGQAEIKVYAMNDCGEGELSDAYVVNVFNSLGINELGLSGVNLYPNPGNGEFNLSLNAEEEMEAIMRVTDLNGRVVFEKNIRISAGSSIHNFNLMNAEEGIYTLRVSTNNGELSKKVVLQK